mmetsp:Transcript_96735/g.269187  ORF Transcript_96735/g.269187 Transcript_96735/m.269187 type:complete len:357 (+) Transcript_96735:1333-2403(+)
MRGRLAGKAWRTAWRLAGGAEGLRACCPAMSSSKVSARMASNSTACVLVPRLSLDEPKRQRFRRATSRFSAAFLVFSNCRSACMRSNLSNISRDTSTDSPASASDASRVVGSVSSSIAVIVPRARTRDNADIHPWTATPRSRLESGASVHRDPLRLRGAQTLPRQPRDEPVELLARQLKRARFVAWPGEAAGLQAPRAQPHADPVVDQHLQPVGTPIGEHVGVMRLGATREAAQHLREKDVDAPAQVARAERQPDHLDANHRPTSRSQVASSRAFATGQCSSTRVDPACHSIRTVAAIAAGTRAATKPPTFGAGADVGTPSSRACQRCAWAHQLDRSRIETSLAWAHTLAFSPDAL